MQAQTKKIVIISSIAGAIVLTAGAIILSSKRKKLQALIKAGSPDVLIPANKTTSASLFPLNFASGSTTAENNAIKVVQRYLNAKNSNLSLMQIPLSEDGIFGVKTRSMLQKVEGVNEVSSSLYQTMAGYLSSGTSNDPSILKNDLFSIL
jgi:hypothetical protein